MSIKYKIALLFALLVTIIFSIASLSIYFFSSKERDQSLVQIAVISMPVNRRLIRLYSIVIPVTDFVPVKKLIYGIYMAFSFDCTIKLLGVKTAKTSEKVNQYLTKSQQIIRENCHINVEIETMFSRNIALAVNQFAIQHSADLIIVNPGTQTRMPGFFASLLGNIIQKFALPPVLTISTF